MKFTIRSMALTVALILCACGGGGSSSTSTSISVSPTSLSFKATTEETQKSANVTVNYEGDGVLVGFPPDAEVPTWLYVVPMDDNPGQATFAVNANALGLAPGAYSTILRFVTGRVDSQGNASAIKYKDVRVALNLAEFSLSPGALNLESPYGATAHLTGALTLQIANGQTWKATNTQPWLTVTPSGIGPGLVDYAVNPSGLALGIHTSAVTVTGPEGLTDTATISLTIRASRLTANPTAPVFTVDTDNASATLKQSLHITDELDGSVPAGAMSWNVQSISAAWLELSPTRGSSVPGVYATLALVEEQLATMANGTYTADVILAYADAENQARSLTVPVTLNLNSPLRSISVTPGTARRIAGSASVQFTATGTYATGYSADLTDQASWTASSGVATVGNGTPQAKGLGTPIAPGTATITAAMPGTGVSGAATFTVIAPLGYAYLSGIYESEILQYVFGDNGELSPINSHESAYTGSSVGTTLISPSGNFAYAVSGLGIHQFAVAPGGYLEALSPSVVPNSANSGLITVDPSEHYLYASGYNPSSGQYLIRQYRIAPDGRLSPLTPATISSASIASIVTSPSGGYVFTLGLGVTAYSIGADGSLTQGVTSPSNGAGLVIHPTGRAAYLVTQYDVQMYMVDADGALTPLSPPSVPIGSIGSHIVVDAAGANAYGIDSYNQMVRHYKIGADLKLTPSGTDASGVPYTPIDVALEPSGKYLYISGNTNLLAKYTLDGNGDIVGEPTYMGTVAFPRGFAVRSGQ